jgi:hypothetical protein
MCVVSACARMPVYARVRGCVPHVLDGEAAKQFRDEYILLFRKQCRYKDPETCLYLPTISNKQVVLT